jgi:predicted Zn-dependent protease
MLKEFSMFSLYPFRLSDSHGALRYACIEGFLVATLLVLSAAPAYAQAATSSSAAEVPVMTVAEAHKELLHGKEKEAIQSLQRLAAVQPPVRGAIRELGITYYRTGRLEDAEKTFTAAMAVDPLDSESEQMRGLTLYRLNRRAAAVPFLEHTRKWTSASSVDVNYVLGRCYIDARRYDDARAAFAAQYSFGADSGAAYLLMAQMLVREELPELAEENTKRALQLSPQLALTHFVRGKIALARGDTTHALAEFEEERTLNPGYPPLYELFGDLYIRTGQFQEAQHSLTQALSLDQTSTGPFILMGKLFLNDNDPQTAASYLEHAEQMDSSNYITHYLLARAYQSMSRKEDAAREMSAVKSLHAGENQLLH